MNKTIIININGAVFHIEEDAYELLKNYMTDVKRHFLNSADSLEITTDIENRIAEMFNDILARENKQVIVEEDVKQVIGQMGTVDDFEHVEEDPKAAQTNTYSGERTLFRDPDDHLIAGVCAGLANYFSIDPVWVRLLFVLAVVFGGTGFILYLILWLVIPKAVTRADRMAMRGQKLDLQGFKNSFEEELNAVHGHLSDLQAEAKPLIYKTRDFFGSVFYHLGQFIGQTGRLIVKILGALLLLVCFGAAIALIVFFVWATVWGGGLVDIFPFSVITNGYADRVYASAFLLAFIPVVAIILLILKAVFHTRSIGRTSGSVMLAIWLCALVVGVYYGSKIGAGFRESASFTRTIPIQPTKNGTYYLKLNDLKYFSHDDSVHLDMKKNFHDMIVTDDDYNGFHNEPRNINLKIEKSDVTQPVLEESFRAQGRDYSDALLNARNTSYIYTQQDSVLKFDYQLHRIPTAQWHDEEISLTLKVPLNAKLLIDKKLDRYIDGINLYACDNMPNERSPAVFFMTDHGLQCHMDTIAKTAVDTVRKVKRKNK